MLLTFDGTQPDEFDQLALNSKDPDVFQGAIPWTPESSGFPSPR
jgi:hypothetical protein